MMNPDKARRIVSIVAFVLALLMLFSVFAVLF